MKWNSVVVVGMLTAMGSPTHAFLPSNSFQPTASSASSVAEHQQQKPQLVPALSAPATLLSMANKDDSEGKKNEKKDKNEVTDDPPPFFARSVQIESDVKRVGPTRETNQLRSEFKSPLSKSGIGSAPSYQEDAEMDRTVSDKTPAPAKDDETRPFFSSVQIESDVKRTGATKEVNRLKSHFGPPRHNPQAMTYSQYQSFQGAKEEGAVRYSVSDAPPQSASNSRSFMDGSLNSVSVKAGERMPQEAESEAFAMSSTERAKQDAKLALAKVGNGRQAPGKFYVGTRASNTIDIPFEKWEPKNLVTSPFAQVRNVDVKVYDPSNPPEAEDPYIPQSDRQMFVVNS